ncbi:hypothetical protein [uncultured Agrobacterium sp.]|uniref:hypothetical protein n=1 Tax=uncultured Agrobacterium sp. TaxID=157277 RepID=UPI0025D9DD00|nr:hypothetical protein [uncultured Agrobacterium sp.]
MSADYQVGPLTAANVARAYAIIEHLFPSVSLTEWQAATDTDHKRRNWLIVTDRAEVVRGVCYVFVTGKASHLQMEVPVFASFSLFDERGIARSLFDQTKDMAKSLNCQRIHFWPAGTKGWSVVSNPGFSPPPSAGLVYDLRSVADGDNSTDAAKT